MLLCFARLIRILKGIITAFPNAHFKNHYAPLTVVLLVWIGQGFSFKLHCNNASRKVYLNRWYINIQIEYTVLTQLKHSKSYCQKGTFRKVVMMSSETCINLEKVKKHTVKPPIVDTLKPDRAVFVGIEPLYSRHYYMMKFFADSHSVRK